MTRLLFILNMMLLFVANVSAQISYVTNQRQTNNFPLIESGKSTAIMVINILPDPSDKAWEKSVADNIIMSCSKHRITKPGTHVIKFSRVDPAVVLQMIVEESESASHPISACLKVITGYRALNYK